MFHAVLTARIPRRLVQRHEDPRDDPPPIDRFQVQRVPLMVVFEDAEPVA
ncbi:hypothetical protein [Halorientalis sp.]|nr:hypothetical protein [Halorientalis sp.]